jgi:D-arabinose 1-dehydrogenase-like Zn-dependent alcohol dehydrogenase
LQLKSISKKILLSYFSTMGLPTTFKAARFEALNTDLRLVDLPLVMPVAGELLVKVLATGICHSDESVKHSTFRNPLSVTLSS